MAEVERSRPTTRKRTAAYVLGAVAVVFLLVAGVAFANSISVARVTNNARSLHWTNAVTGTAALTRAGLAQAVTFAELEDAGLIGLDDFEFAMEQVRSSVDELVHLRDIGEDHESHRALSRFVGPVESVIDSLAEGDVTAAKQTVQQQVETAYSDLHETLSVEQAEVQAAIDDNSRAGRQLNGLVVFVLTLLLPGAAVAIYFIVARRQVRSSQDRARVAIEAEREVSRAKDSFIAGLSHELRTPLTSFYGFADVLGDGGITGAEATRETAEIIASEAAEMTRMVDDLLAASRLDSTGVEIDRSPTPINDVIESAVAPFEKAGREIVRERTALVADVDAARLRHVLVNLLSNAVRHGGPKIAVAVAGGQDRVSIEIVDNGPGVPTDREEHLFEKFVHNGDAPLLAGSVGLGLAVAARLVDLQGGTITYQRFSGRTYFTVDLPAVSADASSDEGEMSVAAMVRALSS